MEKEIKQVVDKKTTRKNTFHTTHNNAIIDPVAMISSVTAMDIKQTTTTMTILLYHPEE